MERQAYCFPVRRSPPPSPRAACGRRCASRTERVRRRSRLDACSGSASRPGAGQGRTPRRARRRSAVTPWRASTVTSSFCVISTPSSAFRAASVSRARSAGGIGRDGARKIVRNVEQVAGELLDGVDSRFLDLPVGPLADIVRLGQRPQHVVLEFVALLFQSRRSARPGCSCVSACTPGWPTASSTPSFSASSTASSLPGLEGSPLIIVTLTLSCPAACGLRREGGRQPGRYSPPSELPGRN